MERIWVTTPLSSHCPLVLDKVPNIDKAKSGLQDTTKDMTITEPSLSPGDLAEEEMDTMRDEITPPSSLEDMMSR